jgi:hypothetical protein
MWQHVVLCVLIVILAWGSCSYQVLYKIPQDILNILPEDDGDCGGTVVKVLCYKSEGRWFSSNWCHWNFSLT